MTDPELLQHALARLQGTGEIEYSGEFGAEITTFIPFVFWLKTEGELAGRRVLTYRGMRPYYYFLDDAEYAEKAAPRTWLPPAKRQWPSNNSYAATRQTWHRMPDYRGRYAAEGVTFQRPILFIQNKFCVEWDAGPINYVPLNVLETLFRLSGDRFDVVYSRPRRMQDRADYTADHNMDCDYPDLALAKRFPAVTVLEDFCAATNAPYNLAKLQILAKSHLFIAVQGGGAHLLACFGSSLMLLLHRRGEEHPHTYAAGPYKYLASPPPILMVAHNTAQFLRGAALIANVTPGNGQFQFDQKWVPTLTELRA